VAENGKVETLEFLSQRDEKLEFTWPVDVVEQQRFFCRVARWNIFMPKIAIWVNFRGPWNGKCWNILWTFGII
jgi:hypothetical protein